MKKDKILILAGSWRIMASWCFANNISRTMFEDGYIFARTIDDVIGRMFSGSIFLYGYEDTPDLDEICDFLSRHNVPNIDVDEE